jgi:hypothetical protein
MAKKDLLEKSLRDPSHVDRNQQPPVPGRELVEALDKKLLPRPCLSLDDNRNVMRSQKTHPFNDS